MTCSLDFVDSITASPTVRLALSQGPWTVNADLTEFPPPPLREAVAQSMMADGGVVPSSVKDFRRITLGLFLLEDTPDDAASSLQALYRELDRPEGNILRWHEHTTHPVFFRTYRASASQVRHIGREGRKKKLLVELRAEPTGYGPLETPVSGVTVSTDPAAGSNGCFVDVTGVKGDVEAPAIISFPGSAVAIGAQTLTAVRRRGTPANTPFLLQAEAMTQGTNTTTQVNDANFSGSGNNYSRCTFASPEVLTRLSVSTLGTSGVDLRGRYRVFMRYRKNTSSDVVNLHLLWGDSPTKIQNDDYVTPASTSFRVADLGEISIPLGIDPVYGSDGAELSVSNVINIEVRAERTSGTGTVDFDFLVFVPADDRLAITEWDNALETQVLDAGHNRVWVRDGSGRTIGGLAPHVAGGFPMLSPNQTNRIFLIRNVVVWTLTTMSSVSVSYHPRYLSVRPAST